MKTRIITIPQEEKLTVKDKVYKLILKEAYTTNEISTILNVNDRTIRESIMQLKRTHDIIETRCRCGHSPIYRVKKCT